MNLNEYMDRDFELLRKRVHDVASAYQHQAPGVTMAKSSEMFAAFSRRFAIEDFLLSKFKPTAEMETVIKGMLSKRRKIREKLEDMLMLHVSEPDYMKEIQGLVKSAEEHLKFLTDEFHPHVIEKIDPETAKSMSNALEDRLHGSPL